MARRTDPATRRRQILDAALRVFAQKGFHAARMEDIAQVAGLSKGAIYLYFENKEALIAAVLDDLYEPDLALLEALVQQRERSAQARLNEFIEHSAASSPEAPIRLAVLYEFYAMAMRPGTLGERIRSYYRRLYMLLRELLRQGHEAGEWHAPDPGAVAVTLLAQEEGYWVLSALLPDATPPREQWLALAHSILRGLVGPEGSSMSPSSSSSPAPS